MPPVEGDRCSDLHAEIGFYGHAGQDNARGIFVPSKY